LASYGVVVDSIGWPAALFAEAGLPVTHATATLVTVIADVPLFPSLAAVIVADPAALLVTNPPAFTLATEVLLLDQVTTRPDSALPFASFGVAVSWIV